MNVILITVEEFRKEFVFSYITIPSVDFLWMTMQEWRFITDYLIRFLNSCFKRGFLNHGVLGIYRIPIYMFIYLYNVKHGLPKRFGSVA